MLITIIKTIPRIPKIILRQQEERRRNQLQKQADFARRLHHEAQERNKK